MFLFETRALKICLAPTAFFRRRIPLLNQLTWVFGFNSVINKVIKIALSCI